MSTNYQDDEKITSDANGGGSEEPRVGHWATWSKYVIKSIQGLDTKFDSHQKDYYEFKSEVRSQLAILRTKAAIWGAVAGALITIVTTIISGLVLYKLTTSVITNNQAIDNNQKRQDQGKIQKQEFNPQNYKIKPRIYGGIIMEAHDANETET